jgi:hypothetical protein
MNNTNSDIPLNEKCKYCGSNSVKMRIELCDRKCYKCGRIEKIKMEVKHE